MCENEKKKDNSEQICTLMRASRESERTHIKTLVLQLRDKVDISTEKGIGAYNAFTDVINLLNKRK